MTNELQDGIVKFNYQMISSRSMTVPEFSRLKPSNRVRIISFKKKMLVQNKSAFLKSFQVIQSFQLFFQTGLLKKNFVAMLRLGVIEFLYDVIAIESRSSFAILSDMYIIWETTFWKNKSFCQPPSSTMEMKRLIRKVKD